ncbi:glycoside hydrolase family 3 C-terminal domain-containing protein [Polaribacter sp. M15]
MLTGGSPIAIPELYDLVDAVLFVWYPGEEGGTAVADVIFGDVSPSGKLPITFPKSVDQLPAYEDYNMKGRTYKYMKEEPLFPFGFGLTYTNFEYKDLQINDDYKTTVTLQNTGETDAEEVVQLYISSPLAGKKDPIYDLKAFKRVFLKAGESKEITFNLSKDSFHQFNENGNKVIRKGTYQLYVNGALPSKRSEDLGSSKAIKTTINF